MIELKELLKPPFIINLHNELRNVNNKLLIDLVHWNDEGNDWNEMELNNWIKAALNEKYERDFAEPMWWETNGESLVSKYMLWYFCPKCKSGSYINIERLTNYCPSCGQRLQMPKEFVERLEDI